MGVSLPSLLRTLTHATLTKLMYTSCQDREVMLTYVQGFTRFKIKQVNHALQNLGLIS